MFRIYNKPKKDINKQPEQKPKNHKPKEPEKQTYNRKKHRLAC
jgi:hypothetical protein